MKTIVVISALLLTHVAFAGPQCTDQKKETWQKEDEFQKKLVSDGYKIKKFKVTGGNCYEIYGWDKDGKKVEIYFNPVSGEIVKQK